MQHPYLEFVPQSISHSEYITVHDPEFTLSSDGSERIALQYDWGVDCRVSSQMKNNTMFWILNRVYLASLSAWL